ncbi:MAG: FAD-dependent oxidoreductase [Planctomycetota bacterium]
MSLKNFPSDLGDPQRFEVLVIGGGLAGVCAALAAARLGRKVALVQDRPVLGGNASSEHKVNISGADVSGQSLTRFSRETGIIDELALEVFHRAPSNATARYVQDWVLYEAVTRERNATLFLNAKALEAVLGGDGSIRGVTVLQTSTEKSFALSGKIVIDCSGDGLVAADAGAEFRMGREARSEFHESMAIRKADRHTMGSSLEFICRDMGRPVPFTPPSFARYFESEKDLPFRSPTLEFPDSKFEGCGWWWLEWGGELDTIADDEKIRDELIAVLFGLWDLLKNRSSRELENYALEWICAIPGKRESRRFMGDYILNENDVRANLRFADAVGYAGWPIDVHPPKGIYEPGPPTVKADPVLRTDYVTIPFRSLYSRNVPNLLFAGRNISVTHVALGTTRVMGTCSILGEAAGLAAHLCLAHKVRPRELARRHMGELQQLLLRNGCHIPDLRNEDPEDLARSAGVSASSEAALRLEGRRFSSGGAVSAPCAQLIPVTTGRIDSLELLLANGTRRKAPVRLSVYAAAHVNDMPGGKPIMRLVGIAPARNTAWVRFEPKEELEPGRLYWFVLEHARGVSWVSVERAPTGTNRAAYSRKERRWRSSRGAFCMRTRPLMKPYAPANVVSGVGRPEAWTNIWISDPREKLPQSIELAFPRARRLATVIVSFDDDLDRNIYQPRTWGGTLGEMIIPTLVKDFSVSLETGGRWKEVARVTGNHQRRNVVRFKRALASALRITVSATWGDPSARIYEVRAYDG